jgi:hypothetical protein
MGHEAVSQRLGGSAYAERSQCPPVSRDHERAARADRIGAGFAARRIGTTR